MSKKGLSEEEKANLLRELREAVREGSLDRAREILARAGREDPSMILEIFGMLEELSGGGGGGGGGEDAGGLSSRWKNGALLEGILSEDPDTAYAQLSEACEVLALSDERFIRRSVNVPKTVSTLLSVVEIYSLSAPLSATVAVRCLINILEAWPDASVHILAAGGVRTVSTMLQTSLSTFDIDLMETAISFLHRMARDHPAEVRGGGALGVLIGIFEFFDLTRQGLILATALLATKGLTSPAEARDCFGGPVFQAVAGVLDNDSPALRDTAVALLLALVKPLAGTRGDFSRTYYTPELVMKLLGIVSEAAAAAAAAAADAGDLGQSGGSTSSLSGNGDDDGAINPEAAAAAAREEMPTYVKAAELLEAIFAAAPDTYAKLLLGESDAGKRFMERTLACLGNLARSGRSNSAARAELVRKMLDALSRLLPQLPAAWKSSVPSPPGIFRKGGSSAGRRHHSSESSASDSAKGGSDGDSAKRKKRRKKESGGAGNDEDNDVTMGGDDDDDGGGNNNDEKEDAESVDRAKAATPPQKPREKKGFSLFSLFSRHSSKKGGSDDSKKASPSSTPISATPDMSEKRRKKKDAAGDEEKKKKKKKKILEEGENEYEGGADDDDADEEVATITGSGKGNGPVNGPLMEFGCNAMRVLAELGIRGLAPVKERVFMVLSQVVHGICAKDPNGLRKCAAFDGDAVARVSCFVAEALGLGTLPCVCCALRVAGFLLDALGRDGVTQAWRREGVVHQLRQIASAAKDTTRKKARAYAAWLCDTVGVIDKAAGVGAVPFPELVARAAGAPGVPEASRAAAVAQLVRLAADEASGLSVYDAVEADFAQALALYFLGARCAADLRRPRAGPQAAATIARRLRALYRDVIARGDGGARDFAALVGFANKVLTKCEALPMPTNTAEDIAATLKMARSLKILIKRDPEEKTLPEFAVSSPIGIDASAVGRSIQEYIWTKLKPSLPASLRNAASNNNNDDDDDDDDGDYNDTNNNGGEGDAPSGRGRNGNYKLVVKMNGVVIGQNQPFIDVLSASYHSSRSRIPGAGTKLVNLGEGSGDGSRGYAELLMSIQNVTYRLPTAHELEVFNAEGEPAAFLSGEGNSGANTLAAQLCGSNGGAGEGTVVIPLGTDPLVHSLQHYTPMIELNSPMASTLVLLHVLHCISSYGIVCPDDDGDGDDEDDDAEKDNGSDDDDDDDDETMEGGKKRKAKKRAKFAFHRDQRYAVPVENGAFVNASIAEKLGNCFKHIPSVVSGQFPRWCQAVPLLFGFVLPDDLRRLAFVCNYCGVSRSLLAIAERYPEIPLSKELGRLTELTRTRFSVDRDPKKYLSSAALMVGPGRSLQQLFDVSFAGEAGTGLGPTTEFFALLGQEFTAAELGMWFQDAEPDADGHLVSASGLFPLPYPEGKLKPSVNIIKPKDSKKGGSSSGDEGEGEKKGWRGYADKKDVLGLFGLLGTFTAKSLLDNRILGVPFSRPFLKWMTGVPLERSDLAGISPSIAKTFENLLEVAEAAAVVIAEDKEEKGDDNNNDDNNDNEEVEEEDPLEDAMIPFELPGVPSYPLSEGLQKDGKKGDNEGKDEGENNNDDDDDLIVTMGNVSTYAERVIDGFFGSGVRAQLAAFKAGFDRVLPMESLRVLSLGALEALVCGSQDAAWDAQSILDAAKFEHGYSRTSRVVQELAQVMEEFSEDDRRHFVRFLTGSPRLPAGGFAALNPRLTISKKTAESPQEADKYLPSVNCCFHNIKFTEYSSKEILRSKLLCAIYDGQGAFDFS